MPTTLETKSTLTDRYQTTVPAVVRKALHLGKRDEIHYAIGSDGLVVLSRAEVPEIDDPVLGKFLAFLEKDMIDHPEHLKPISSELQRRVHDLVGHIDVDLDAPLDAREE